jgi:predicted metal-dependent peptidase
MVSTKEKLKEKLDLAKFRLLQDRFCFFGILALYFKYEIKDDVETAYTDGRKIVFGTEFLDKLNLPQVGWVVAHEVMHVSNNHLARRGARRHDLFNLAADYSIHSILKEFEDDLFKMPEGLLYDKKYDGMASEQIYQELYQEYGADMDARDGKLKELLDKLADDHGEWGEGAGNKGDGDYDDGEGNGQVSDEEWQQRMTNAAKAAAGKMAGKMPGFLKKLLDRLNPPKKDWRTLLQEFIVPEVFDYSFNPPDRRYSDGGCMLPDFNDVDESVKNIVFFVDISGSMSEKDICEVFSEVVGAVSQFGSMTGHLGYFDTEVHSFLKFEDISDVLANRPMSGGGTEFEACFHFLHDTDLIEIEDVAGIVVLTDGYCGWGRSEELSQGINTLWVMTESSMDPAPFGRTIYLRNGQD